MLLVSFEFNPLFSKEGKGRFGRSYFNLIVHLASFKSPSKPPLFAKEGDS